MKFVNRSGKVGTSPYVLDTVICCTGPLSEPKDAIPQSLQVLLVVLPSGNCFCLKKAYSPKAMSYSMGKTECKIGYCENAKTQSLLPSSGQL